MRIVSLLPAATDIVAALGALPQLVGRTHECDWPPGQVESIPVVTATTLPDGLSSREISAAVTGAPHRGSSIYHLDHAALDALRPDLILTQDLCDVCAVSYRSVNDAVRVMELDSTVMSLQPATIDAVLQTIRTVGDAIGAGRQADRVIADARTRLAALPGPRPDGPAVLFIEWLDPLMPGGHWVPEQIAAAGGTSLLTTAGQHSSPHLWEAAAALRPEVVVLGPCGFPPERTRAELPLLAGLPGWADLPAVRSGQVWIVDGPAYFNRPGPRIVDGAEILAAILNGRPLPGTAWRVDVSGMSG
ncbi:iron complex transport system substrate-binding protein [Allocatelliglobosispora scoriae]|uniref:Iron complex transport system substrate-binding protein n=1 Tax=Allocatelliglobosispora scoriae TaxID=643052 RepID=A0A841BNH0_9ACTN|nr:cobalamin-binding protein [Allocatelliglobosispora scoriae]MBB5868503.1 iron complex transport system substrate-binding protein [Allocatelliglobosispora scoriae]